MGKQRGNSVHTATASMCVGEIFSSNTQQIQYLRPPEELCLGCHTGVTQLHFENEKQINVWNRIAI